MEFYACLHPGAYWLAQIQAKPMSDAEFQARDSTFRSVQHLEWIRVRAEIKKMKRRLLFQPMTIEERTVLLANMDDYTLQQQKLEEMFGLLRVHWWLLQSRV